MNKAMKYIAIFKKNCQTIYCFIIGEMNSGHLLLKLAILFNEFEQVEHNRFSGDGIH